MYLMGTHGALRSDLLTGTMTTRRIAREAPYDDHSVSTKGGHGGSDAFLAKELAATMLEGKPAAAGITEGLHSAVVAFGIDQAQATGQVVDLRPLWAEAGINPERSAETSGAEPHRLTRTA